MLRGGGFHVQGGGGPRDECWWGAALEWVPEPGLGEQATGSAAKYKRH